MRTPALKVALSSILVLAFLAGCGSKETAIKTKGLESVALAIPTDCEKTKVLEALNTIVPDSLYIPTQWQPAAGTELADVIDNGGLACSYGQQSAEIGTTVKWVSDAKGLFEKRLAGWQAEGFKKVTLNDVKNSEAYFQLKKQSATQEFHVWILNVKYRGAWIQVSCTAFAQDLETGLPLLKAAIA